MEFIIKELEDFELFKHKKILKKNTKNKYFPNLNISYQLILIWLNRHLFYKELSEKYESDYLCHIDWGYFREGGIENLNIETDKLKEDKIYLGLIKNENDYIQNIYNQIKDWNKDKIEKTLIDNLYSIGGGCTILHKNMIEKWDKIFRDIFSNFIEKNIDFKDDQTILRSCALNKKYYSNFELITQEKETGFRLKSF